MILSLRRLAMFFLQVAIYPDSRTETLLQPAEREVLIGLLQLINQVQIFPTIVWAAFLYSQFIFDKIKLAKMLFINVGESTRSTTKTSGKDSLSSTWWKMITKEVDAYLFQELYNNCFLSYTRYCFSFLRPFIKWVN